MSLLRKSEGVKALRPRVSMAPGSAVSTMRPQPAGKTSPCSKACLAGSDVRGVIALLSQREKLGLSREEACDRAWRLLVETNPFPATIGRICPHPCEDHCGRSQKDGSLAVGSLERFLGDWGIERGLALPGFTGSHHRKERVAIIGAGPAGLSCAYQLARQGIGSTIFESMPQPGGMLRYGIPPYRLPNRVLMAEVQRILDLGVELRTGIRIGRDISMDELRLDFASVFVAPGAGVSRPASIPGIDGVGVHPAVHFLREVAQGEPPTLGKNVVVVGGGDTAIDVARVCARLADRDAVITILRVENESIGEELSEAIEEGVHVEFLATLRSIVRNSAGRVERAVVQRVTRGPASSTGFPTLVPVSGGTFEIPANTVILALGQKPDVTTLLPRDDGCLDSDATGKTKLPGVWRGGDAVNPSFAALVIAQGRQAAVSMIAELNNEPRPEPAKPRDVEISRLKVECYEARPRLERHLIPVPARLADLLTEVEEGPSCDEALAEAGRCMSCGSCFGCERCWMYCTPGCMKRLPSPAPGQYFAIKLETCDGCRKCVEECPCGFLEMT